MIADHDAERIVLGSLMLDGEQVDPVAQILTSGDFNDPRHGTIFAALIAAWAQDNPTDPTALAAQLLTTGELNRVGGAVYLHEILASVPTTASATWYARVIAEHSTRRHIIYLAERVRTFAADPTRDIGDVETMAERELANLGGRPTSDMHSLDDLIDATLPIILSDTGPDRGLSTGIGALDDLIGGLKPGQLIIVAGRPGAGKSVACVDFTRACIRRHIPAAFFSLEMHRTELVGRILSATADVNLHRVLNGGLQWDERKRLRDASEALRGSPLSIQTGDIDLPSIRSTARKLRARGKLDLLVVDYIQLMSSGNRRDNRVLEVGEISRGLKQLAGELEIPIVAAAQLNRSSEQRIDRRPQLSDLRESGSLEQDADIVILLHRPDQNDHKALRKGEVDLIVAKNRNGALDTVEAAAQLDRSRFVDKDIPA